LTQGRLFGILFIPNICSFFSKRSASGFGNGVRNMEHRPTTIIRELLVLSAMRVALGPGQWEWQEQLAREIRKWKQVMTQQRITVTDRRIREQDIWVQYRHKKQMREVVFMRRMLDAEARGRLAAEVGMQPLDARDS
jgi:hypothetical protein